MVTRAVRVAPLLAATAASLLLALWAGLSRVGFAMGAGPRVVVAHGPLMVVGVLGTVIAIERAVAVGRSWALLAPVFSLVAALGLALGAPWTLCAWPSVVSAAVLVLALGALALRGRDLAALVIGVGALVYFAGCVRWALGAPIFGVLPYWTTWLVLTIAGERLELTRVMPPSRFARASLVVLAAALAAGVVLGPTLRGAASLGLAAWLFRFDVARRVLAKPGLPRFTASTLLGGYGWLAVGGAILVARGDAVAGPVYDAATHAVMLGFVFSMVFAHAPTILARRPRRAAPLSPGVLRARRAAPPWPRRARRGRSRGRPLAPRVGGDEQRRRPAPLRARVGGVRRDESESPPRPRHFPLNSRTTFTRPSSSGLPSRSGLGGMFGLLPTAAPP